MNVKRSFFNKNLFFNTIKKTLPYCIIVSVICFLYSFGSMKSIFVDNYYGTMETNLISVKDLSYFCAYTFSSSAFCKCAMFVYAFIISVVIFNYLYNNKLSKTIHSLPITRTAMYISNILAGFVAIIIPYIIATITVGIYCAFNGYSFFSAFPALGSDICFSLIFYSIGILSVMLTGHILSTPAMFMILNFGIFLIENLYLIITHSMLFGLNEYSDCGHIIFTPIVYLCMKFTPDYSLSANTLFMKENTLIVFAVYTVLAIILCVVSCILYNYKKLENQGDPITIKKIQPFFHYLLTVIAGCILAVILYAIFSATTAESFFTLSTKIILFVLFIISSLIAFYVIKMLFTKTVRVFKTFNRGLLVYGGISTIIFVIFAFDLFNIEQQIPEKNSIKTASISVDGYSIDTSNQEIINKILAIHGDIIDNKDEIIKSANAVYNEDYNYYCNDITINYTKKDGSELKRYYVLLYDYDNATDELNEVIIAKARDIVNSNEAVYSTLKNARRIENINFYTVKNVDEDTDNADEEDEEYTADIYIPDEYNDNFKKALLEDAKNGNLHYYEGTEDNCKYLLSLLFKTNNGDKYIEYNITDDCVNTLKLIGEVIQNEKQNETE